MRERSHLVASRERPLVTDAAPAVRGEATLTALAALTTIGSSIHHHRDGT
jgi:hypothetical protein